MKTLAALLALFLSGCATVNNSADDAIHQAREQKDLQAGLDTGVLKPDTHLGTVTP